MTLFTECKTCAVKPGSPQLCPSCFLNRTVISRLETEVGAYRARPIHTAILDCINRVRFALEAAAWPTYACEFCVGQEHGCYCGYHGGIAPGIGPQRRHLALRWLHKKLWPRSLYHTR